MYRLAFLPILLSVLWVVMLVGLTHPARHQATILPENFGVTYEDVEFTSADGVTLKGWYFDSLKVHDILGSDNWQKLRPAVVICHGYGLAHDQFLYPVGMELIAAGYDVLTFDFRGHGNSDNAPVSFGTTEAADVVAAVDFLHKKPGIDPERIGLFGSGMGGYAAIIAAPRCQGVKCVVANSTYTSVPAYLRHSAEAVHAPPVVGTALAWGMSLYFGHRTMDESADDAVRSFGPRGLLLVNGTADKRAPAQDLDNVRLAGERTPTVAVSRAEHCCTFSDPATIRIVLAYFQAHLNPAPPVAQR